MHVKSGDNVLVISGKNKGQRGRIRIAMPKKDRVIIENVNIVKKHVKQMGNRPGGILEQEAALHVSNVQLICESCGKASRTGHRINEAGRKVRVCKACNADVDK